MSTTSTEPKYFLIGIAFFMVLLSIWIYAFVITIKKWAILSVLTKSIAVICISFFGLALLNQIAQKLFFKKPVQSKPISILSTREIKF
jgi:hypothetical protein